jgi:hypothetical protein
MNREIYSSGIRTFVLFKCLAALQWPLSLQSESRKKKKCYFTNFWPKVF